MDDFQNGDYVEAKFEGSKYYGTISRINKKWGDAVVTVAPGIQMVLPLANMTKIEKGAGNGTYSI